MPLHDDAEVYGALGKRGYGKSTWISEQIRGKLRVVGVDPMVTRRKPLGQFALAHRTWNAHEAAEWIRQHPYPSALRLAVHSFDSDDFAIVSQAILDSGGRLTLALDEVQLLCPNQRPDPWLTWWLACGRHYDVEVYWSARRPAEVARLCTSQAGKLVCFRLDEDADIEAVRGRLGDEACRLLPTLPRFSYVTTPEE